MRPIDTIRKGIDSDLIKYHSITLCKILSDDDIRDFKGVGLCALVVPIEEYDPDTVGIFNDEDIVSQKFPVLIVNRPTGWFETNYSSKYHVMVLSAVHDRGYLGAGVLISKTGIDDVSAWQEEKYENVIPEYLPDAKDPSYYPKTENGGGLKRYFEEFILNKGVI